MPLPRAVLFRVASNPFERPKVVGVGRGDLVLTIPPTPPKNHRPTPIPPSRLAGHETGDLNLPVLLPRDLLGVSIQLFERLRGFSWIESRLSEQPGVVV